MASFFKQALIRVVLLVLVLFQGCAGPRHAALPPSNGESGNGASGQGELKIGDYVRIETLTGDEYFGEVQEIYSDHVVLGRVDNYGYTEGVVQSDQIRVIELNGGLTASSAGTNVAAILGVAVAIMAVMFISSGGFGWD